MFVLLALALMCSPLLLSYNYLRLNEETLSPAQIAKLLQNDPDSYYRSAMHDNLRELALEQLRLRQPEIIALGSSLSYDFRQEYFESKFGCGCGAMDSITEGEEFVDQLTRVIRPKLALFVLDFWWFTDESVQRRPPAAPATESPLFSFSKLRLPFKQWSKGLINWRELAGMEALPLSAAVRNHSMGLMARLEQVGERPDGSQLKGIVFNPRSLEFYAPLRKSLADADAFIMQPGRFGPDLRIHEERLLILARAAKKLQDHGTHVVLIYPPMAPQIVAAMRRSGHHAHFFDLPAKIAQLGFEFYDLHSPLALGIQPGEFSDTHHAGNTAYMRLLIEIVKTSPGSPVARFVDVKRLSKMTEAFRGTTVAVFEHDHVEVAELDFLGLGVSKEHAPHVRNHSTRTESFKAQSTN